MENLPIVFATISLTFIIDDHHRPVLLHIRKNMSGKREACGIDDIDHETIVPKTMPFSVPFTDPARDMIGLNELFPLSRQSNRRNNNFYASRFRLLQGAKKGEYRFSGPSSYFDDAVFTFCFPDIHRFPLPGIRGRKRNLLAFHKANYLIIQPLKQARTPPQKATCLDPKRKVSDLIKKDNYPPDRSSVERRRLGRRYCIVTLPPR